MRRLSAEALDVLGSAVEVSGHEVRITRQLTDRKLYTEVDAALRSLGGAWNRKARAHVFPGDPADALDQVVVDGAFTDAKRDLDQFFTPPELAKRVVRKASVAGRTVLEPSAGHGALAAEAVRQGARVVHYVEKDEKCCQILSRLPDTLKLTSPLGAYSWNGYEPCDFLKLENTPRGIDRVVLNPPFSRQADIDHVTKAFGLLVPGGRLVAIMAAGVSFRQDRKATSFRELVEAHGEMEPLPEHSFRESGTDVNTVIVTLDK